MYTQALINGYKVQKYKDKDSEWNCKLTVYRVDVRDVLHYTVYTGESTLTKLMVVIGCALRVDRRLFLLALALASFCMLRIWILIYKTNIDSISFERAKKWEVSSF